MSSHGGSRPGAGRKPGKRSRKTAELIKAVEAAGITPLDYMLSILRDETKTENIRLQAARDSAPYIHSKLQSLEVESSVTTNHVVSSKPLDIDEWLAKHGGVPQDDSEDKQEDETTH